MVDAPGCLRRYQYFQSIYGSVCHPTPETSQNSALINALKNDPLALPIPMFSNAPRPTLFRAWMSWLWHLPRLFSRVAANHDHVGVFGFAAGAANLSLVIFFISLFG